jgi:hypothetical protein
MVLSVAASEQSRVLFVHLTLPFFHLSASAALRSKDELHPLPAALLCIIPHRSMDRAAMEAASSWSVEGFD